MNIRTEEHDSSVVLVPEGDVDLNSSRELQLALRSAFERGGERLVVDLAEVPYMDSSGVATLVEGMQIARKHSTRLILCNMQEKVRSIFEIARLDRVFTIVGTRDEASSV